MPPEPPTPRLPIFEGIMGSGKSTATRKFGEFLAASGTRVAAFTEAADPHPVRASDDLSDFFQPWAETGAEMLAGRVRDKWARYVQQRLNDGVFTVMDGQLFHGDLSAHARALMHVVAPLKPVVIYFRPENLPDAIDRVFTFRGEEWEAYQPGWKLRSPYAAHRQLTGRQGLTAMYEEYRALTDGLFAALDCPKLAIDTGRGEWPQYHEQVRKVLAKVGVRV